MNLTLLTTDEYGERNIVGFLKTVLIPFYTQEKVNADTANEGTALTTYHDALNVPTGGCYSFTIYDESGADGICCAYGERAATH